MDANITLLPLDPMIVDPMIETIQYQAWSVAVQHHPRKSPHVMSFLATIFSVFGHCCGCRCCGRVTLCPSFSQKVAFELFGLV